MRHEIRPPPGGPEDILPTPPGAPSVGSIADMLTERPYGDEPDEPPAASVRPARPYPPPIPSPVPVLDFVHLDEGGE